MSNKSTKYINISLLSNGFTTPKGAPLSLQKQAEETAKQAVERAELLEKAKQLVAELDNSLKALHEANASVRKTELKTKLSTLMTAGSSFFQGKPILNKAETQSAQASVSKPVSLTETEENKNTSTYRRRF